MKPIHSLKSLALVLLIAVMLHDGVALGVWTASSPVRLFVESKVPLGGADEEPRGTDHATTALRSEFLPASDVRPTARRLTARHLTVRPALSGRSKAGTTKSAVRRPDSLHAQVAVLRTVVLRV